MNLRIIALSLLLTCATTLSAQTIIRDTLHSQILNMDRELIIYKPWQLEEIDGAKVNVIYVFDAQSRALFDLVHATVNLYGSNSMPFMVVGVASPYIRDRKWNRNTEFLPMPEHKEWIDRFGGFAGKADSLIQFLGDELIPYIDDKYPTLPRRLAIGHSNGGNMILHALFTRPGVFTDYLAFSPNWSYDYRQIVRGLKQFQAPDASYRPFLYVNRGNESPKTGFWGWDTGGDVAYRVLDSLAQTENMDIVTEAFPEQSHMKTYVRGLPSALEQFFASAFGNVENLSGYLDQLEAGKHLDVNADLVNDLAYDAFWGGNAETGNAIVEMGIARFPTDSNLHDSHGEMLEALERKDDAKRAYETALTTLEKEKAQLSKEDYDGKKKAYQQRLTDLAEADPEK